MNKSDNNLFDENIEHQNEALNASVRCRFIVIFMIYYYFYDLLLFVLFIIICIIYYYFYDFFQIYDFLRLL